MPLNFTALSSQTTSVEVDARSVLRPPVLAADVLEENSDRAAEPLATFTAALSARGDHSYAQLVVTRVGPEEFVIEGQHCDDGRVLAPARCGRPRLALGDLATRTGLEPEDIDDALWEWSRLQPKIGEWLEALREEVGDDSLRLVIWDSTGFDIPWEMFALPGDEDAQRPQGSLGALVAVVRRVVSRGGPGIGQAGEDYADQACSGGVLAYLDDEMLADRDVLSHFDADLVGADALMRALESRQEPVALVYLGCHGTWGTRVTELRLGGFRHRDISRFPLPALAVWKSLVFLNACHAGRLIYDAAVNAGVMGFAEAFLRRGAGAVVGPTGPVEVDVARWVAQQILDDLAAHPELPVSVALRNARASAAQSVAGHRRVNEQDLKNFIYSCMYVCYGNPYFRLQLSRRAAP